MQIEFRYRFEAAHRFLNSASKPCMTPHGHTWYATLALNYKARQLNSAQMTVEFSEIKKEWKHLIQETFDHSYMHHWNDPVVEVLNQSGAEPRLIPFPGDPTTELISLLLFNKMNTIITKSALDDFVVVSAITIEETPTNKITCGRDFYKSEIDAFKQFDGWWNTTNPEDRSFRVL